MADAGGSRSVCEQCNDYARLGINDTPRQRTDRNGKIVFLHKQCDYWYDQAIAVASTATMVK